MEAPVKYQPRTGLLSRPLILAIPILIGLFFSHSPYTMTAVDPSEGRPWADAPITLVTTPQYLTKKVAPLALAARVS